MSNDYKNWIPEILSITKEASVAIQNIQERKTYQIQEKLDNSPVTSADLVSHQIIENRLKFLDATIPILSEEGENFPFEVRSSWPRYWLVDPLDGTREFIKGTGEYTVNIALIENHIPVLGFIAVPNLKHQYWAIRGSQAYHQIKEKPAVPIKIALVSQHIRVVSSYRFNPKFSEPLFERLNNFAALKLFTFGSSLKFCLVAEGKMDLYPQTGKTCEWDTAAGQCILEAAGGHLLDIKGKSLKYNLKESLENPPFYAIGDNKLVSICCG